MLYKFLDTFNIVVVRLDDCFQSRPVECWFVALVVSHANRLTVGHFSAGEWWWRWCIATVDVERWCVQLTISSCTVTITSRAQQRKTARHSMPIFFLCSGYYITCMSTYSMKQGITLSQNSKNNQNQAHTVELKFNRKRIFVSLSEVMTCDTRAKNPLLPRYWARGSNIWEGFRVCNSLIPLVSMNLL